MMYGLVVLCFVLVCSSEHTNTIMVQPTGHNSTLEHYLCNNDSVVLNDTTLVLLSNGNHIVSPGTTCVVENVQNLLITSNETATVVCQTSLTRPLTNRGFAFIFSTNITFSNIIFENCGGVVDDKLFFTEYELQAVLLFLYTSIISLSKVSILRYSGYGLLAIDSQSSANFDDVTVLMSCSYGKNISECSCSGSGIAFLFNYGIDNMNIRLINSVFKSNTNHPPVDKTTKQYGRGGGLSIMAINVSFTLSVTVKNCHFEATTGTDGGVSIVLSEGSVLSHIEFNNCTFNGYVPLNTYMSTTATHYIGLGVSLMVSNIPNDTYVIMSNSIFKNYVGFNLSPVVYLSIKRSHTFEFKLNNVTCIQNMVSTFIYIECIGNYCETDTAAVIFEDIKVENNGYHDNLGLPSYKGILMLNQIGNVYVIGTTPNAFVFRNNSGSSLHCTSCKIHLVGYLNFLNNSAYSGTVIHGIDSLIYFTEGLNARFIGNNARTLGGVILLPTSASSGECSFQFNLTERYVYHFNNSLPNISMTVYDNNALFDGYIIYAYQIYNCTQYYTSNLIVQESQLSHMYYQLFNASTSFDISTDAASVCICITTNSIPQCSNGTDKLYYHTYPGKTLYIDVVSINGINEPTFGFVLVIFNTSWTVRTSELVQQTMPTKCNQLPFTISTNITNRTGVLALGALLKQPSVFALVNMSDCPIGYKLSGQHCTCDPLLAKVGAICNVEKGTIAVLPPLEISVWVGLDNGKLAISKGCPLNYCYYSNSTILMFNESSLCINNRQGTVCGKCIANYSIVFGSKNCMKCSNYWLFTLILFAVAGLLLVCILFLLRISISSGVTAGLIVFANFYSTTARFTINDIPFIPGKILLIWLSWMSLDLGFPLCFFDGMTELDKAGLQFVFPLYLIVIVIIFIILSSYSTRLSRLTSHYSVQVLATLIFLSYSKVSSATIDSLLFIRVQTDDHTLYRWYFDANIFYLKDTRHVILGVASIVVLLFIVLPYTVLMSALPFMYKYRLVNQIRPFLDAHFGPYKTKYQWWFGVRLWLIFIIDVLSSVLNNYSYHYLILMEGILLLGFAIIQAYIKPFRSKAVNILDLLVLSDYIAALMLTMAIYFTEYPLKNHIFFYIGGAMIGAIFLLFCIITTYQIIVITKCVERCKKSKWLRTCSSLHNTSGSDANSDENVTIRSPDMSHQCLSDLSCVPPTLREPLLSESFDNVSRE